jgi:hypothetical protein
MAEIVLTNQDIDPASVLSQIEVPADAFMFLERVPSNWLDSSEIAAGIRIESFGVATDWALWERGRVFCSQWELRWEGTRTAYTGVAATLSGFALVQDLSTYTRRNRSYYLWGERSARIPDGFVELRVARTLHYPVAHGSRVKLRIAEWFDSSGELVASRLLGLEGK